MDYTKLPLFEGIAENDLTEMKAYLGFREKAYGRGETILASGQSVNCLGIVLSGSASIENTDAWGNRSVLSIAQEGQVFAEAYALSDEPMLVDVVANGDCRVLYLSAEKLMHDCGHRCQGQPRLIRNLLVMCAVKNVNLSQRIFDTSSKTIRGRLTSYLSREVSRQGSRNVTIPFDRQQLADYLSVDRSALSKELSKMKRDGLIDYNKNRFVLKTDECI